MTQDILKDLVQKLADLRFSRPSLASADHGIQNHHSNSAYADISLSDAERDFLLQLLTMATQ